MYGVAGVLLSALRALAAPAEARGAPTRTRRTSWISATTFSGRGDCASTVSSGCSEILGAQVAGVPYRWTATTQTTNLSWSIRERQHDEPVAHFDKPHVMTVSGVHRGEQRRTYDRRREQEIPTHGLRLVVIKPKDLASDGRGRLLRHREVDVAALRELLGDTP